MRLPTSFPSTCLLLVRLAQGSPIEHEYGIDMANASWASSSGGDGANTTSARAPPQERVPGDSTVWHCKGTGPDDLATLDYINMSPKVLSRYASRGII